MITVRIFRYNTDLIKNMPHLPWQTLSSKVIYQNKWMCFHEDKVIRPDGNEGIYSYLSKEVGVFTLARSHENHFYFIREYRYPVKDYVYQLPGGGVGNKDDLSAAKRELLEETGLIAKKWHSLGKFYIGSGHENSIIHSFLATDVTNENEANFSHQEGNESIEGIIKLSLSQVKKYISTGIINCGITLATWSLYQNSKHFLKS